MGVQTMGVQTMAVQTMGAQTMGVETMGVQTMAVQATEADAMTTGILKATETVDQAVQPDRDAMDANTKAMMALADENAALQKVVKIMKAIAMETIQVERDARI